MSKANELIEFEWFQDATGCEATEALFEEDGKYENGIVIKINNGEVAITISELKQLVEELEKSRHFLNP